MFLYVVDYIATTARNEFYAKKPRVTLQNECVSRRPTKSEIGGQCYLTPTTRDDESRATDNTPWSFITRKRSFNACHREGNKNKNKGAIRSRITPYVHPLMDAVVPTDCHSQTPESGLFAPIENGIYNLSFRVPGTCLASDGFA